MDKRGIYFFIMLFKEKIFKFIQFENKFTAYNIKNMQKPLTMYIKT